MKFFLPLVVFVSLFGLSENAASQSFPSPASLATGQGAQGSYDPIWLVSTVWNATPPNPMTLSYVPAFISNGCAAGSWINPATLPPPTNNGNWISNANYPCSTNTSTGYIDFRLPLNLPGACDGRSISSTGSYTLYFSGYVDNSIYDVYVNGASMGVSGGGYSAGTQLNMTLPGPWIAGINYVDVMVYNLPNGGQSNPYGLLLVANSTATDTADSDGDGTPDIDDACPCLYGTRSNGCPAAIAGDTIICLGGSTTLYATEPATGYLWSTGATTDSITISPTTNTSYSLTVTGPFNFRDSGTVNVTVNSLPPAAISPAASAICIGNSQNLTASGGTAYVWNNAANTTAITVSPTNTTTYSVTVTNANNCTATASSTVTVNPLPSATINPPTTAICIGNSTMLIASGGTGYVWSNADNTAAINVSPITTTTYSVTVTDINTCTATASSVVTVNLLPIAAINPAVVAICTGASTTLTASGGVSYAWSNAANTAAINVSPTLTTAYSVIVTDANSCSVTAGSSVTVNPLPVAVITPATTEICQGASATLTGSGGVSYVWSNTANTAAITVSPLVSNNYSVTVTDANSCTGSATSTVTVDPKMVLTTVDSNVTCNGGSDGSIDLTVSSGQSPYAYLWNTSATGAGITGLSAGAYSATVTDNNGCTDSISAIITQPTALALTSSFNNPSCVTNNYDGSITINVTGGVQPYQYNWSDTASGNNLVHVAPGNYAVTASDANNCTVGAMFSLAYTYDFSVLATPSVSINLGGSTTLAYTLTGNAGNFVSTWSPPVALGCVNCDSTLAGPTSTTLYQIEVKNDVGCIATDTVTVIVTPDYALYVPNVFSPNGDGNNDLFSIHGNTNAITFFEIKIFDRWGELVFESNDVNFAWDGTFKGNHMQPGVLVWQMKLVFLDGHNDGVRTGSLTLLR